MIFWALEKVGLEVDQQVEQLAPPQVFLAYTIIKALRILWRKGPKSYAGSN